MIRLSKSQILLIHDQLIAAGEIETSDLLHWILAHQI